MAVGVLARITKSVTGGLSRIGVCPFGCLRRRGWHRAGQGVQQVVVGPEVGGGVPNALAGTRLSSD
jgi:hypothetical protein